MSRRNILILIFVALAVVLFYALDLREFMTFEAFQASRGMLLGLYRRHPVETVALFTLIFIIQSALALPGPLAMSLAAGAIFGIVPGAVCTSLAASIGASITFFGSRYIFAGLIERKFGARLARINAALEKEGFWDLLFLRLVPIFPFTLINIAAGTTRMRYGTFFGATLPAVFIHNLIVSNAGASIGSVTGREDIFSLRVIVSLSLLGLLALLPVVVRRMRGDGGSRH